MALAASEIEILSVEASGPDCGTFVPHATATDNGLAVRALLEAVAQAAPPTMYAFHDASCAQELSLRLPEGKRLVVTEVRYPYKLRLASSSGASHGFRLSAGEPSSGVSRWAPGIAGSADVFTWHHWSLPPEAAVRTGCGGEQTLVLTMLALVRSQSPYRSRATIYAPLVRAMPGVSLGASLEDCAP